MFFWISKLVGRKDPDALTTGNALVGWEVSGMPVYREMMPLIATELQRSRRYEHPLAVLVLSPDGRPEANGNGRAISHAGGSLDSAYLAFFLLGALLRDASRESDIVTYAAEHHLYVAFLSESDEVAARHAARRFGEAFFNRTSLRLRVGLAQFPADGLTLEDLFEEARAAWRLRPLADDESQAPAADGTHG